MKNRNLDTKKMPKSALFYPLLLFVATLFMSIGFASINPFSFTVNGSATIKKPEGVYISNVVENGKGTDEDFSLINSYYGTNLSSTISLSETNTEDAYVTLKVTLTNATDYEYTFKGITYDDDIEICYDNDEIRYVYNVADGTKIPANSSIDINVTFSYKLPLSDDFDNVLNSLLNFDVSREHSITYKNLTGTYPSSIADGEDLIVNFTSEHPETLTVKIDGEATTNYTYSNYILTIEDVTGDVEIIGPVSTTNAKAQILADNTVQAAATITDIKSSTQSGLFSTTTSLGMTYFFRGSVDNNYVLFADKCFKVVRINENDSIKAVYTGEANGDGTCPTGITLLSSLSSTNFNSLTTPPEGVKYAYSDGGTINSSNAKVLLESWFASNFVGKSSPSGSDYSTYFGDGIFCGDNSFGSTYKETTYLAPYKRVQDTNPTLECSQQQNQYTLQVSTGGTSGYGNNLLTYPVGLLSSDEFMFASISSSSNKDFVLDASTYLYSDAQLFTISPGYIEKSSYMVVVNRSGKIERAVNENASMIPAVNFKSDLLFESGDGTSTNPYIVSY